MPADWAPAIKLVGPPSSSGCWKTDNDQQNFGGLSLAMLHHSAPTSLACAGIFGLRIGSGGFLMPLMQFVGAAEKRAIGAAVSAAVLHTAGRGFESLIAHHRQTIKKGSS